MAKIKWEKGGVYYEAWSKTKSILIESMEKKTAENHGNVNNSSWTKINRSEKVIWILYKREKWMWDVNHKEKWFEGVGEEN